MTELSLWFSKTESPELIKTVFSHPQLSSSRQAVRGRPLNVRLYPYSFQWSPAVRALSCLLLRGVIVKIRGGNDLRVLLSGGKKSAALSLDHAISKQPTWLTDIFGEDSRGDCLIRKFVSRRNSGMKRSEPVELALDKFNLPLESIKVFYGDEPIDDSIEKVESLLLKLDSDYGSFAVNRENNAKSAPLPEDEVALVKQPILSLLSRRPHLSSEVYSTVRNPLAPKVLTEMVAQELYSALRSVNVLGKAASSGAVQHLSSRELFSRVAGLESSLLSDVDLNVPSRLLEGKLTSTDPLHTLLLHTPLRISLPAAMIGTLSLFIYMKETFGYPLAINYGYPSTGILLNHMLDRSLHDSPDICGLSSASAAVYLGRRRTSDYSPLMITPKTSHRVVSPRGKRGMVNISRGQYVYDTLESSTTSYFFNDLKTSGFVSERKVNVAHMQAHEMSEALGSGDQDLRAILWFPFDRLNVALNNCMVIYGDADPRQWKETIIFGSEKFSKNRTLCVALTSALRRAWLNLLTDNNAVINVARFLTNDPTYMTTIYRYTGIIGGPPPNTTNHLSINAASR